jgi:hypothetical protein
MNVELKEPLLIEPEFILGHFKWILELWMSFVREMCGFV